MLFRNILYSTYKRYFNYGMLQSELAVLRKTSSSSYRNVRYDLFSYFFIRKYSMVSDNKINVQSMPLVNIFLKYGFSDEDTSSMFKSCKDLTKLSEKELMKSLNSWSKWQFSNTRIISLLREHPNLIFVHEIKVAQIYKLLSLKYTRNEIYQIFFNAPHLILVNKESISGKIKYLEETLLVPHSQIVNSAVLGYPLHYIKERFEFLKRVGVYKEIRHKDENVIHVNPRIDGIVSSTDEYFSTKVAGVSLLEYEVFQHLYKNEEDDEPYEFDDENL